MTHMLTQTMTLLAAPNDSAVQNESMAVVHAVPGSWLEQTQTWLYEQVSALPTEIENHIVCPRIQNHDQFELPNIHAECEEPASRRILDRLARKLRVRHHSRLLDSVARETGASVLHSHFGSTGWENLSVARNAGLKHVVTFYGLDVNYLPRHGWAKRYDRLFDEIDLVLCEGPHMASCIVKLGCEARKVRVHHLGVNLQAIDFMPRRWIGDEPLRFLMAASFREKKGLPYAVEALGRIEEFCPIEVTIIGDATSSSDSQAEKRRILQALASTGLDSKVRMLGFQSFGRLLNEAAEHHVFLSPSVTARSGDTEGGAPVCLIEMLACGMNIVSTRHCDIPEIIHHGQTGWLADERDVDGLVECVRQMIDVRDKWADMQKCGRAHVEYEFNSSLQARHLASIYQELVNS